MFPFRILPIVASCLVCGGCYSLGVTRHTIEVTSGEQRTRIHVWVQEKAPLQDSSFLGGAMGSVLLYPFNALLGVIYGVCAPFNAERDVRYGPIGWIAAVVVPGCTVGGPLKGMGAYDVELDPGAYADFLSGLHRGDSRAAFRSELRDQWWPIDPDAVVNAVVAGDDEKLTSHGARRRPASR